MRKGAPSTHLWVAFVSTVFRNTGREIAKGLLNQIQPVVISNEPACPMLIRMALGGSRKKINAQIFKSENLQCDHLAVGISSLAALTSSSRSRMLKAEGKNSQGFTYSADLKRTGDSASAK